MNESLNKSESFVDLIISVKFKENLTLFLDDTNNDENDLIFVIKDQKNENIENYILQIGSFLLKDENLANFLTYISQKELSENDFKLITAFYSYILKISEIVNEYSASIINVSELTKKSITDILLNHKTEYTEFDLFDIGFPQKDQDGFYITKYNTENSILLGKELFIQIESDNIVKYINSEGKIFKDLKGESISNITNSIEIAGGLTILSTVNILGNKQLFQYIHSQDGLMEMGGDEAYIQELKMLQMDMTTGNLMEKGNILDVLIVKSSVKDYDVLTYINNEGIHDLDLQILLKRLNPKVKITDYIKDTQIEKIKRIIDIEGEVFCELDIIEKNYGEYEDDEESQEVDENDYTKQKRSIIMTIEGEILQDINENGEDIDLVDLFQQITILGKNFILYRDANSELGLMDKNGDVVKINFEGNLGLNLFQINEFTFKLKGSEEKYYRVNEESGNITHDDLITQLEEYTSF